MLFEEKCGKKYTILDGYWPQMAHFIFIKIRNGLQNIHRATHLYM